MKSNSWSRRSPRQTRISPALRTPSRTIWSGRGTSFPGQTLRLRRSPANAPDGSMRQSWRGQSKSFNRRHPVEHAASFGDFALAVRASAQQHWAIVPGTRESGKERQGSMSMRSRGIPQFPSYGFNSDTRSKQPEKAWKPSSPIARRPRFNRTRANSAGRRRCSADQPRRHIGLHGRLLTKTMELPAGPGQSWGGRKPILGGTGKCHNLRSRRAVTRRFGRNG